MVAIFEAAFEDGEGERIEEVLERGLQSAAGRLRMGGLKSSIHLANRMILVAAKVKADHGAWGAGGVLRTEVRAPSDFLKHRLPGLHRRGDVIAVFETAFEDGEGERIEEVLERGLESAAGRLRMGGLIRISHTPNVDMRRCSAEFRFREGNDSESEFRATTSLASACACCWGESVKCELKSSIHLANRIILVAAKVKADHGA